MSLREFQFCKVNANRCTLTSPDNFPTATIFVVSKQVVNHHARSGTYSPTMMCLTGNSCWCTYIPSGKKWGIQLHACILHAHKR